jgi:ATP-dependent Clp protease ATP-binding subunit ClpC
MTTIFHEDRLNLEIFTPELRRATDDWNKLLATAAKTQAAKIESTHILMALANCPNGVTVAGLSSRGLTLEQWQSGLAECVEKSPASPPLLVLDSKALHESARLALESAATMSFDLKQPQVGEAVLLHCALRHVTNPVRELLTSAGLDMAGWMAEIEKQWRPVAALNAFETSPPFRIASHSFSKDGRAVLDLMRTDAESLGASVMEPHHLLLALLEYEGGAAHHGLFLVEHLPRKLHEVVMTNIRGRSSCSCSTLPASRRNMHPLLARIIDGAGKIAAGRSRDKITEAAILESFLSVDSFALRILRNQGVNIEELRRIAGTFELPHSENKEAEVMADIQTIKDRLHARIVGQDEAIERMLPHIQRFRFGFRNPGRPIGVFLFCGQSGSGKTEVAKELARAVFASEEQLLFLEMGQFNTPESMSIFVGAPPGYVGYGEGKLTNGLRDKPNAVVLFDEVEKAHSRVLDALLRFLDEGRISDPAGPVREGSQCLVVLTSNVGADELGRLWQDLEQHPNRHSLIQQKLRDEFKKRNFRVEFLNRVDEIILFRNLDKNSYVEIARRRLREDLSQLQKEHGIEVEADPSIAEEIGARCAQIGEGARAVHRLVHSMVITPVIDHALRLGGQAPIRLAARVVREAEGEARCQIGPLQNKSGGGAG